MFYTNLLSILFYLFNIYIKTSKVILNVYQHCAVITVYSKSTNTQTLELNVRHLILKDSKLLKKKYLVEV